MAIIVNDMAIPLAPLGILALMVALAILWRRQHNFAYLFFFALFWLYLLLGLDKVFFPIHINGEYVNVMRQSPLASQINLVPFYFGPYPMSVGGFIGLVNNIVLTVPFGFGLNFILRLRARSFIGLAFALGLSVELTQLMISLVLGYPYRTIDVNDVLMNAAGVLLGYGLFWVFVLLYLAATKRFAIKHEGLAAYMDAMVSQAQTTPELTNA